MDFFEFFNNLHKDPKTRNTAIVYSIIVIAIIVLFALTGVHLKIGPFEVNNNPKHTSKDSAMIDLYNNEDVATPVNRNPYWHLADQDPYSDTSNWSFVIGIYNFGNVKAYDITDSIVLLWQTAAHGIYGVFDSKDTFYINPDFRGGFNRSINLEPGRVTFLHDFLKIGKRDLRRKFIAIHIRYTDEFHKKGLYAPIFDASDMSESGVIPMVSTSIYEGIDKLLHEKYNW